MNTIVFQMIIEKQNSNDFMDYREQIETQY